MLNKPVLLWRILLTLLVLTFVAVPGSRSTWFNGLPLSPYETLISFIILVIIWAGPGFAYRRIRLLWSGALILLILWQLVGAAFIPTGWSICLERVLEKETLTTPCEPSAEDKAGNSTFTTNEINYVGPSFPLYFMNEAPFNYTSEEEPNRHDMPYTFTARTYLRPQKPSTLLITTNTPHTAININGQVQDVLIDEPLRVDLTPNEKYTVTLYFTTARSDSDALQAKTEAPVFYTDSNSYPGTFLIKAYQAVWSILILGILSLSSLSLYQQLKILTSKQQKVLIYAMAILSISALWQRTNIDFFALMLVSTAALFTVSLQKWRKLLPFFLVFLAIHAFIFTANAQPYNELTLLEGGDDTLTHENLSRLILKAPTLNAILEGGQTGVYYFQPLHRYFLGLTHKVVGESIWAPAFVQTYLLAIAILLTFTVVKKIGGDIGVALISVFLFFSLALFENTPIKLALSTYQEAIGLPLFLITLQLTILAWYTKQFKTKTIFIVSLLWGLTISTRNNLSPAALSWLAFIIATLFILTTRRARIRTAITGFIGIAIFPSIIVIRNIIVAGKAQFITSSLHPNLIDPFRPLFPNIGGASELTFPQVISKLLETYSGRTNELITILWNNMTTHYIGTTSSTQVGWSVAYILIIIGLLIAPLRKKIVLLMLLFSASLPMLFGSLFLHRQIAVTSQSNYLLALILSVATIALLPKKKIFKKHHK